MKNNIIGKFYIISEGRGLLAHGIEHTAMCTFRQILRRSIVGG
jgi:hypothetical protein